jgi:uncharacterized protein (TIGR02246 family)
MDEEAIKQVLATYVDTWNTHDMATWGALFTDDVDYVNRGGGWWQSNKENVEGHKAIHDMLVKQKQQMTYTSTVAKIAFLKPDVALVHATWEWPGFPLPAGKEAKDFKGIITMVMVKQADTWLIRAVQNTLTSAPAQAAMQASSRNTNPEARSIGVSINRPPNEVYDFASNPENLPQWATGLGGSIQQVDGEWVAEALWAK